MTETKAVASLPNLDIEIRHRQAPDEAAEYLSISLRATPSLNAMADYVANYAPYLGNPMVAWLTTLQFAQALWAPWLGGATLLPAPTRAEHFP